jgi:hypothetical protein
MADSIHFDIIESYLLIYILIFSLDKGLRALVEIEKDGTNGENNEIKILDNLYSDIYLTKCNSINDLTEYQFKNKENRLLWRAHCNFIESKINSITLYTSDSNIEMKLRATQDETGHRYIVKNNNSTLLGYIEFTPLGFIFKSNDNRLICSANLINKTTDGFGAIIDGLITLDTFNIFTSKETTKYFTLNDDNNETLGKYFVSLKNIDLSSNKNNKFDVRVAALFSILIDNSSYIN